MRTICNGTGIYDLNDQVYFTEVDEDGNIRKVKTHAYTLWKSVVHRVNSDKSYVSITLSDSWKYYSNFKAWYDVNYIPDFEIDKDLKTLFKNRSYSAESCLFLPKEVNNFLIGLKPKSDKLLGVQKYETRYQKCYKSQINISGKGSKALGWFYTELEAHLAWVKYKLDAVDALLNKYEGYSFTGYLQKLKASLEVCLLNQKPFTI